ncbi:hypothetical protein JL722_8092 [Aureococcus anophagefferens]|nr:hypothetical protein JL722_8092 [Aureococcus anophagefferens]
MAPLRRARPLPSRVAARRRCATTAPESKAIEPPSRAQLWRLALNVGVPFVGFGFADNLIMILAGDAIDNDIVGIGAGDVIERYANVILGKSKSKPLTTEQLTHRASRAVKGWASAVGISVGCVIGMFPLLFLGEKKELYFTSEEMALYESVLRPYGVSPQNFFSMMRLAKWRELEPGEVLVRAGTKMDRIVVLANGSIDSYEPASDGGLKRLYRYRAKRDLAEGGAAPAMDKGGATVPIRGCVIGGTALLDASVRDHPYPSTTIAAEKTRVVEFDYGALRKDMDENPAIEAAILNILYFDLVEGLRRRGQYDFSAEQKKREPKSAEERTATYALLMPVLMQVVLSDGVVHATEREFLSKYVIEHSITEAEHRAALASQGWTSAQWDAGVQDGTSTPTSQIRTAIPGLLKQAGIKSRITKASATDDDAAPPPHKGGK